MTLGATPNSGSLRLRFVLAITFWVVLGIGSIWFAATRVFANHIEQMYHEELEVHVRELARLTQFDASGAPRLSRPLSDPRYEVPLSGFYWQVSTPGQPVLRSESMTRGELDESVAHSPDIAHEVDNGPTGPTITYGLLEESPSGKNVHVVIATDQSELDDDIAEFTRDLTMWLVSLAALLLASGVAIISFGLRPLDRLGKAMTRVRMAKAERLEGRYPSEIAPLVDDLNAYIRSNTEIVARARVQAGNLAHSLRTPLAIMTDEAERLTGRGECAPSGQVLLDQIGAMQHQIDFQLARARAAAGARVPGNRAILQAVSQPIFKAMRRLHRDKRFILGPVGENVAVAADSVNLAELLSILLDNAGKWARSTVTMTVDGSSDRGLAISIRDDGPGMTPEQIAHACDIGSRFDESMAGTGLGLAIARDLCDDMGARLVFASGPEGLTATIEFPPDGEPALPDAR